MRRNVQQQIIELVLSVIEGVQYSSTVKKSDTVMVLEDCQLAMNAIDNSLKIGLSEKRYLFYHKINNNIIGILQQTINDISNNICCSMVVDNVINKLECIKNEVKNESEVKLEVVFLPYKSSMWDCLESIWRSCVEDPTCESYVIPIPYYLRNANPELVEFCYEGENFPDDVPITHYNSYDFSIRKPDIIYIHNPFDESNYVTSVEPDYYSYMLKKYTDLLVYVPYFVTGGKVPESHLTLPLFKYMDLMVVQSEKYKLCYKNHVPEDKILALGSPKIDKLVYFENHKPHISKELIEKIKDKKVIMYNISVSSILDFGIKAIQKMQYIFSVFKKRNDVILLWRPHPLIESTLKSIKPNLLKEYIKAKEQFIRENIGIYDDNPDITASITISDAYIGEASSSVVHLFGGVGKPIFLLNIELNHLPTEENLVSIFFHDCYYEKDTAWSVCNGYSDLLCKMDMNTKKINIVAEIPSNETLASFGQYRDILKVDEKIILMPYESSTICEYNLLDGTLKKIPIKNPMLYNFSRMIRYKDNIFMIPERYPAILQYDIKTGICKYHKKYIDELLDMSNGKPIFLRGTCVRDNLLLIASSIINKVLEFNMDTGKIKLYTVSSRDMNFFDMTFDGNDYWLIPNEGKTIVRWNYVTGKTIEYNDYPDNFNGDTRGFIGIIECGSYMLVFPRESNMIIKIDIDTGKMSEFKIHLPYKEGDRKSCYNFVGTNYQFVKKYDNKHVVAFTSYDNSMVIINTETEEYEIKECRLDIGDAKHYSNMRQHLYRCNDVPYAYIESQYFTLDNFIVKYVVSENGYNKQTNKKLYSTVINNTDGTCGKKTHQYIKRQLLYRG